jgi:putative ABC transport system substrate-binding protein
VILLGCGTVAAWPLAARAQQGERMRRISVLTPFASDDPAEQTRVLAFAQALAQSGWIEGRNVRVDIRWAAGDPEGIRRYAAELVALAPDVILAVSSATTEPLLQATRTVPIVFVQVAEPVGAGFVETLARPGGNATGFMLYEYGISGKWLELLKEIAPGVKRVGFLQNLVVATGLAGEFGAMQAAAPSLGLEVRAINARDAPETERAIAAFARPANGGLIAGGAAAQAVRRDVIINLAARHRLPALYLDRAFVAAGGLMAYGPDRLDQYRSAAGYVDRILKGEKPADLPVQAPTKYELAINLKTARALGLDVPATLLARADEVIE